MPTIIIACVIILVLAAIWITAIARNHRDSYTRIDNSSVSVSGESRKKASTSAKKASTKQSKSTAIKLQEAPNQQVNLLKTQRYKLNQVIVLGCK